MITLRKFAAALILGLVMSMALLTTGAFAQSANWHRHHHSVIVVNSVAVAGTHDGFGGWGGWGWGGFGCNDFFGNIFGGGAFASASASVVIAN